MNNSNSNTDFPGKQINNNAITTAFMGIPFKPNTMTQGNTFAIGRQLYMNNVNKPTHGIILSKKKKFNNSAGEYINTRKNTAIGKSSTNTGDGIHPMAFSGADQTSVKTALWKVRGGGCVAPKKKGGVN